MLTDRGNVMQHENCTTWIENGSQKVFCICFSVLLFLLYIGSVDDVMCNVEDVRRIWGENTIKNYQIINSKTWYLQNKYFSRHHNRDRSRDSCRRSCFWFSYDSGSNAHVLPAGADKYPLWLTCLKHLTLRLVFILHDYNLRKTLRLCFH